MGRQGSSLMQVRLLWFWRNHRMRNRHPARLLLLPDCHHVHRMLRKGLAITAAPHGGGISHDKRVAVEFSFKLAQRVILQSQLLQVFQSRSPVELPGRGDRNEIRRQASFHFVPVLRLHFAPEHTFQAFAAGSIGKALCRTLVPDGTSWKHRGTAQQNDR